MFIQQGDDNNEAVSRVAVRELCRTSQTLQEVFQSVNRCEEEILRLQESIARLNASNTELRAQLESKVHDLFTAQGERDVLRLLMMTSSSLTSIAEAQSSKKDHDGSLHTHHRETNCSDHDQGGGDYIPT